MARVFTHVNAMLKADIRAQPCYTQGTPGSSTRFKPCNNFCWRPTCISPRASSGVQCTIVWCEWGCFRITAREVCVGCMGDRCKSEIDPFQTACFLFTLPFFIARQHKARQLDLDGCNHAPRTNFTPFWMDASNSGTILSNASFSKADNAPMSWIFFTPSFCKPHTHTRGSLGSKHTPGE
jgi:hypothetical protein